MPFGRKKRSASVPGAGFHVEFPRGWSLLSDADADPIVYRHSSRNEQLTVSVMGLKASVSDAEREQTARRFVEVRREAELSEGGKGTVIGPVGEGRMGDILAVRYEGSDETGRFFSSLMLCSPAGLWNFYLEGIGVTEDEFSSDARTIMNSIAVAGSKSG